MKKTIFSLSPLQLGIWSRIQLYGENGEYEIPLLLELDLDVSSKEIEDALNSLIEYNAALRVEIVGGQHPLQKIESYKPVELWVEEVEDSNLNELLKIYIEQPMSVMTSLTNYKLFRSKEHQILACKFHHIIADGHSVKTFENELLDVLSGKRPTKDKQLYENYLENSLSKSNGLENDHFWDSYLQQATEKFEFPKQSPLDFTERSLIRTKLDISKQQLAEYALKTGSSLFATSLAIYRMFVSRFFGKENYSIGIPVSTRRSVEDEETFAFMANVLPFITPLDFNQTCITYQRKIQETVLNLILNCEIPAADLQRKVGQSNGILSDRLFETIFDVTEESDNDYLLLAKQTSKESEFPWIVNYIIKGNDIYFETNHDSSICPPWFMEEIHVSFQTFIHAVLENPNKQIGEYPIMNKEQESLMLFKGNIDHSQKLNSLDKDDLFAKVDPSKEMIWYQGKSISFERLEYYSEQFGGFLQKNGISEGAKFVVCTKNKLIGTILFYCIQKNKCCYIPISSVMPEKRIESIIEEAQPLLVFTDFLEIKCDRIQVIKELTDLGELSPLASYHINDQSRYMANISYVIFTSGSTGKPKGVPISYENLASLVAEYQGYFDVSKTDVVAQVASFSFDASLFEMTLAFCSGAKIAIFDEQQGYEKFPQFTRELQVTHFLLTPDYYAILNFSECESLKCVLVGGAPYRHNPTVPQKVTIYNAYGPSEATIMCSLEKMNAGSEPTSIGLPMGNSGIVLIDERGELTPHGLSGEICITGRSVFSGYLDSLLPSSLITTNLAEKEYTFYRTGDIAYFNENWHLQFISRKQNMVKIRGNRVDPEEISQLIMTKSKVSNVTTIVEKDHLFTFYVGTDTEEEIGRMVREYLPSYMIPKQIIRLEKIPLNVNGKLDKSALTARIINDSEQSNLNERNNRTSSFNTIILDVFKKVLESEEVTLQSNFYAVGGDSIRSIQVSNELHKIGLRVSSLDIMKCQTIGELCEGTLDSKRNFDQREVVGEVELLPIQRWFFSHNFSNINHWNQSEIFKVSGAFRQEDFITVYKQIRSKHDGLRSQFIRKVDGYVNHIRSNLQEDLEREVSFYNVPQSITHSSIHDWKMETINQLHQEINIESGLLSRVGIFQLDDENYEIVWILHHLICDNVSWMILKNDFMHGLEIVQKGEPVVLIEKTTNIKEWAEYLKNRNVETEIRSRWHNYLPDKSVLTNGITDNNNKEPFTAHLYELDDKLVQTVQSFAEKRRIAVDLLLFLLFSRSLCNYLSTEEVWVTRELNGRTEHPQHIQLNQTLGWFTSMHPVKVVNFDDIQEFVSMNQFDIEKNSNIAFDYQFMEPIFELPNISYNYLGHLPEEIDVTRFTSIADINSMDFFDEVALNIGMQNHKLICVFLAKENNREMVESVIELLKKNIQQLSDENEQTKNVFGISSSTLIDLNELFL
ncbi:condensation domain-containing protein [Paenibacillus sp. SN-8-1]|uniref:condensation domain-containing protein n=1 Tax=Paenibacillus sp. SN-8-1 TaxID=3435409 RepID=UPI003D9A274E